MKIEPRIVDAREPEKGARKVGRKDAAHAPTPIETMTAPREREPGED